MTHRVHGTPEQATEAFLEGRTCWCGASPLELRGRHFIEDGHVTLEAVCPQSHLSMFPFMSEEKEAEMNTILERYHTDAMGRWEEHMQTIREMHPEAVAVVKLYRSALVVLLDKEQAEKGGATVLLYHDPRWMGEDATPESFRKHCARLVFWGQRNGPDVFVEAAPCRDGGPTFHLPGRI